MNSDEKRRVLFFPLMEILRSGYYLQLPLIMMLIILFGITFLGISCIERNGSNIRDKAANMQTQRQIGNEVWGDAVEGVQVRLRTTKPLWKITEIPFFQADIRNSGKRDLQISQAHSFHELEYDGAWYIWSGEIGAPLLWLPADRKYENIRFTLDEKWHTKGFTPIERTPGRHKIRVAFIASPTKEKKRQGKPIRAISNMVEIEIIPPQKETRKSATQPETTPTSAWGEEVEGLRCRWVLPIEQLVHGTAPILSMEVQNVSSNQIIWECKSGMAWAFRTPGIGPHESWVMPKFQVHIGRGATPEYPSGRDGSKNQPTDFYKLQPGGHLEIACALPWILPKPGRYEVNTSLFRHESKVKLVRMTCPPLSLDVPAEAVSGDKIYWGAADTLTGIQLGLGFDPDDRQYRPGEMVTFKVYVRNTGDQVVRLKDYVPGDPARERAYLLAWSPTVRDVWGKRLPVSNPMRNMQVQERRLSLPSGTTSLVGIVSLQLTARPDERPDEKSRFLVYLEPGQYRISQTYRFEERPEATWYGELTSGELSLSIRDEKRATQPTEKKTNSNIGHSTSERNGSNIRDKAANVQTQRDLGNEMWGNAVEGVQVRLRTSKTLWKITEIPSFQADIRNSGKLDFQIYRDQGLCELEYDGIWYHWSGDIGAKSSWFPPDRKYENIPISLVKIWHTKIGDTPLEVTPGRHRIRVAFIAYSTKEKQGKPIRAISNMVDIEVVSQSKVR
ncbi:MAG: hypothetical protein WC975_01140 [Phycisphaerae bacterium]